MIVTVREPNKRRLRCLCMKVTWLLAIFAFSPALALANYASPQNVPYLPVTTGAAVILNSGSTNTSGYRIVVQRDGSAQFVSALGRSEGRIPAELAQKLFQDLKNAAQLNELPHIPCMKSMSFGSYVFVYWNHSRSPDLSCPSNANGQAIFSDAMAIAAALHLNVGSRSPVMRPLLPGEARHSLNPAPSPSP